MVTHQINTGLIFVSSNTTVLVIIVRKIKKIRIGDGAIVFILTDGKNYVMENPMKIGEYISTTSPLQAKEFTYKQARSLVQNKKKSLSWIKQFHIINKETGQTESNVQKYSNEGIFCGDKNFEFDENIIDIIKQEVDSIIGLATWDINQLNTYMAMLNQGVQFYDNAIQDIKHARLDKRPPAHIRTKIDGIANELEEKRRDVKQTRNYIDVLIKAIKEQWSIGKIKAELSKAKYVPYKGRTKYYEMVENLLKEY